MSIQKPKPPPPPPVPIYTLRPSEGAVTSLNFTSDGQRLLSGSASGVVSCWCLKTFRKLRSWSCHDGKDVTWIGRRRDDTLYTQGRDRCVCRWALRQDGWVEDGKVEISSYGFCNCDIVGDFLVSPTSANDITVSSLNNQETVSVLRHKENYGMCMCLKAVESSAIGHVVCGYEDGSVVYWDLRNSHKPFDRRKFYDAPVMCLDYDASDKKGICGSSSNELVMWSCDGETTSIVRTLTIVITNSGVASVKIRKDRSIFAAASWDARLRIFSFKKGKALAVLDHHAEQIQSLAFSDCAVEPYGQLLAAGSRDERISIWNIYGE